MRIKLVWLLLPTLLGSPRISGAQVSQAHHDSKPAFSMTLTIRRTVTEVGSPLMLGIALTNTSDHDLSLGRGQLVVLDSKDKPVPLTPYGRKLLGLEPHPRQTEAGPTRTAPGPSGGGLGLPPLHPGHTRSGTTDLNVTYDLKKPGTYTIQAMYRDPYSKTEVESNVLTATLIAPSRAPERPKTSFTLYISTDEDTVRAGDNILLNVLAANTSDHQITYDAALTKDDIQVRDAQGKLAPLTKDGRALRAELGRPGSTYNLRGIGAGDTLPLGDIAVGAFYDLRQPGDYTIQILRFDDETKTWVKSNAITLTVTP